MTELGLLLLRADASPSIGAGHLMRSLALAQAWRRRGGSFAFATRGLPAALADRVATEGGSVIALRDDTASHDAEQLGALVHEHHARAVVIDGYSLTTAHHRAAREAGAKTLVIDDTGEHQRYECDLVLNQNLHAHERFYRDRAEHCRLLLGVRYTLLRQEYLRAGSEPKPIAPIAKTALLSFGGADPAKLGERAIDAMDKLESLEAVLLIGAANPRRASLEARAATSRATRVLADVTDMPRWLRWADVAVVAAGSTVWELAFMGVPALVTPVADNQLGVAEGAARAGFAASMGHEQTLDAERIARAVDDLCRSQDARRTMSAAGRATIDGAGADRVVAALLNEQNRESP